MLINKNLSVGVKANTYLLLKGSITMRELNKKELQKLRNKYTLRTLYLAIIDNEEVIIELEEVNSLTFKFYYYILEDGKYVTDRSKPIWSRYYHNEVKIKNKIGY